MQYSEVLESRRMLSVSVAYDRFTGTLNVNGDKNNDDVRVEVSSSTVTAGIPTSGAITRGVTASRAGIKDLAVLGSAVRVYDAGKLVFDSNAAGRGTIRLVNVDAGAGDDSVTAVLSNSTLVTRLAGNIGNDTIITTASGGQGATIDAGDGNDTLRAADQRGAASAISAGAGDDRIEFVSRLNSRGQKVEAGDGNDTISLVADDSEKVGFTATGGAGDDVITGSLRSDQLFGEAGKDQIFAGDGDDHLDGGTDDDSLFGESGDDTLEHGGGNDVIDGGAGFDRAHAGGEDKVVNVEELT
jgi:Ca2+-binding RTX toxin-like protein